MWGKKKRQKSQYDGHLTPLPELRINNKRRAPSPPEASSSTSSTIRKRVKVQHNGNPMYRGYFDRSMEAYLRSRVSATISKSTSKSLDKDITKLKSELTSKKVLPPSVMSNAADAAGLEKSTMAHYMELHGEKRNAELWNDFAKQNFDDTFNNLKNSSTSASAFASTSTSALRNTAVAPSEENTVYRTCTVSLNKIIRKDLPQPISVIVHSKFDQLLLNGSNFQAEYLLILKALTLVFKDNSFVSENGQTTMQMSRGFDFSKLLPKEYQLNHFHSAAPLSSSVQRSHPEELASLFAEQHLFLIQSYFFGKAGANQKNLESHPIQLAMLNQLATDGVRRDLFQQTSTSQEMAAIMTCICTNVKNMWTKNTIFNKLLGKLLQVLFRLHLASDGKPRKYDPTLTKKKLQTKHFGNHRRNILRYEYKKLHKLKQRSLNEDSRSNLEQKIRKAEDRIAYFKTLPRKMKPAEESLALGPSTSNVTEQKEQPEVDRIDKKSSRSRINAIKSVSKHFLFSGILASDTNLKEHLHNPSQEELQTMKLVIETLKPYIPDKKNYLSIAHQLPFCLLANDVLEATGYQKFTRPLFPEPSFSSMQTANIDALVLYQLLTSEPNPLIQADFSSNQIDSLDYARSNKEAVFCSVFDMNLVHSTCKSYKLKFAHHIQIAPGKVLAHILGSKYGPANGQESESPAASRTAQIIAHPRVIEEGMKEACKLKKEISSLEEQLVGHKQKLKELLKANLPLNLTLEIKALKALVNERHLKETQEELVSLKKRRGEAYDSIHQARSKISQTNQDLYFKRNAVRFKSKLNAATTASKSTAKTWLSSKSTGIFDVEACQLDPSREKLTFSGTDNGFVNLSFTVPFDMKRYKFHLKLHNSFQVLEGITDEERQYLALPKASNIKAADIDVGCGHRKERKKLKRSKKHTQQGAKVVEAERVLSMNSLHAPTGIAQLLERRKIHQDNAETLRTFYASKSRQRMNRFVQIQKKRFLDILVTKERRVLSSSNSKNLVMFVGDRGTGVGSSIKGFRRYGGKWLEQLRGKRGTICITNEHMTSQTCLYCFQQLEHPCRPDVSGGEERYKKIPGVLMCVNSACVSVINGYATKSRDALSALAIGLSGASYCLLGTTMPCFSPSKIGQSNTEDFKQLAAVFLREGKGRCQ